MPPRRHPRLPARPPGASAPGRVVLPRHTVRVNNPVAANTSVGGEAPRPTTTAVSSLRPAPSPDALAELSSAVARRLELWEVIRQAALRAAFQKAGVQLPRRATTAPRTMASGSWSLNMPLKSAMSNYIRRVRPTLAAFVELVRGQTADDYRPNKALLPATLRSQCRGYRHLDRLLHIASEGVRVQLRVPLPRQRRLPRNHPSASTRINVLRKNIRKEQYLYRCLVVDADIVEIWPELFVSPFGVVDKGDGDPQATGRVIHDLSHPENASVNSNTDCSDIAAPTYEHCSRIAREISRCKATDPNLDIELMAGDVASAYRNACIHSQSVHMFAGHIPEDNAIVIDMSAAFGWTGSAGTYGVLGGAVAHIHGNTCNSAYPGGFFDYHWVDDHINVSANTGSRCDDINRSLRYAMTSVMGPAAVNEDKFTAWGTQQQVLGLLFDTRAGTVAMPPAKIAKARNLVAHAFHATSLARSELRSLLGSLRHVATCVRPAQAFLQRLRTGEIGLHRRHRVAITNDMRADLEWWWQILADPALNGVPFDYFGALPEPDLVVATDASDEGLCALVPVLHLNLTYRFTPEERALIDDFHRGDANEFGINYRELLSCVIAVQAWALTWRQTRPQRRPLHIHFRVDNTSAVSWQSKMSSRNGRAQVLIRLPSLWEQTFGLRFSASHIPGVDNVTADAGSRRWGSDRLSTLFAELTSGWTTTMAPGSIREVENVWRNISDNTQSQIPRSPGTLGRSNTGSSGRPAAA